MGKQSRKQTRKQIKGGNGGGAADYGMYVWGINQSAGPEGNLIQPIHDPRGFGQAPVPQGTQGGQKGGGDQATISPASVDSSTLLAQSNQMATDQIKSMMTPDVGNVHTDSANPAARHTVTGGKKKRRTKKKIYTKNKRQNGRRKRRTSKIR
jgi:hypothetical protein